MVTSLRTILKSITKTLKLEPAAYLAQAKEVWPGVAGPVVAASSAPVSLRGSRLFVGVTHPALGQEIKLRQADLVRALSGKLGSGIVTTIVPVHRRSLAGPSRHAKRRD